MGYMDKRPSRMQGSNQGWGFRPHLGVRVMVGQGRGMLGWGGGEALVFLVLPLPAALTRAMLVGGI